MKLSLSLLLMLAVVLIALVHIRGSLARNLPISQSDDELSAIASNLTKEEQTKLYGYETPITFLQFTFDVTHLPCDMDMLALDKYVDVMPNHCIWVYNNRFVSDGMYFAYKVLQSEAFFFGQFYERLKRFELAPHEFESND